MRRILITGAFSPIGRAVSHQLALQGWELILHYYRTELEQETPFLESIRHSGCPEPLVTQSDFRHPKQLEHWWNTLIQQQPMDAIIHNAAVFYPVPPAQTLLDDWDTFLHINLVAPACLSDFFLRQTHFTEQEPGRLIFILDIYADKPLPGYIPYAVSKSALKSLTRNLARQSGKRFCINGISPGIVNPNTPDSILRHSVTGTHVPAEEVASACSFLLHQRAIHGEIITIDGGKSLF